MNFDIKALFEVLSRKTEEKVNFLLAKDSKILVKSGERDFRFDNDTLEDILKLNDFNYFHKEDTIEKINEVLSNHIINQLAPGR